MLLDNGYCLPVYMRCNGVYDCPDHEDEKDCEEAKITCPGFYRCGLQFVQVCVCVCVCLCVVWRCVCVWCDSVVVCFGGVSEWFVCVCVCGVMVWPCVLVV